MKKVYFDVGANNGNQFLNLSANDPNVEVFAFEPTPELQIIIESKVKNLPNYKLIKAAVSDYNGVSEFNVAGQSDWGSSSLLKFSKKSETDWPGRSDFKVTEKINVNVIRLDSFIEENNITSIDYLHIDTQGSDLNVLKGLGDKLKIVNGGVMEAATKKDILYDNQNTVEECIQFLESNNFLIEKLESNDQFNNEVNIHFRKKKIAVFFSGRINNKEPHKSLTNIKDIQKKYDPIFFISLNNEVDDITFTNLVVENLNIQEDQFKSTNTNTPDIMFTFYKDPSAIVKNSYSQFKHNNECMKMIELYQKKHNMKFDIVIKYRMDINNFNDNIIEIENPITNTCYIPEGQDWGGINDQIAYGDFESMYKYCNVVNNIVNLCQSGVKFHPETLLLHHLEKEKLNIKRFKFNYTLLDRMKV